MATDGTRHSAWLSKASKTHCRPCTGKIRFWREKSISAVNHSDYSCSISKHFDVMQNIINAIFAIINQSVQCMTFESTTNIRAPTDAKSTKYFL